MKDISSVGLFDDTSLGASFESSAILAHRFGGFNIQLVFTGSPVGTFKLQCCNDVTYDPGVAATKTWDDIPDSEQAVSAAGSHTWIVSDRYKWVRVAWVRTSGTGTCDATFFAVQEV
jgi:hypothetical protein